MFDIPDRSPATPILPEDVAYDEEDAAMLSRRRAFTSFWRRYARNRMAVAGMVVLLIIVALAIFAPQISRGYDPNCVTFACNIDYILNPKTAPTLNNFPLEIFGRSELSDFRRPIFVEVLYAARPTLIIGLGASVLAALIGTILGGLAGYFGSWVDSLISWLINLALALPFLPLVIALLVASALVTEDVKSLVIIFGVTGWPVMARLVRANLLILREQDYTEAARAVGVGSLRIIWRHLLPNAAVPIIITTTLNVANFILAEATLDYLGILKLNNPIAPEHTWGLIIAQGQNSLLAGDWWWVFYPGLFISLTVLSINYIGEGLRDALDVRGRVF